MDYAGFAFRMCNLYLRIDLFGFRVPTSWQASPLAIHLARGCLLVHAPNPILIAEVSSAAARSANASIQI